MTRQSERAVLESILFFIFIPIKFFVPRLCFKMNDITQQPNLFWVMFVFKAEVKEVVKRET